MDQAIEQPSGNKNRNELRDQPNPTKREKREEITVAVCVYCWVDNHQPSLVTSVSTDCHTKPNRKDVVDR